LNASHFWEARHGRIVTHKGGWRVGHGIRVGAYSLLDDLLGQHGFFELLILEVTGRMPKPGMARWLEACFMCMSFPDPRIWCNQIGALGGSMRCTPGAAVNAGTLASDSTLYGPGQSHYACQFIAEARHEARAGATPAGILARRTTRRGRLRAPGYSRPIASGDDRVEAMLQLGTELGLPEGEHMQLARQLDAYLRARGGDALNMLGYIAAFVLDSDISVEEGYRLFTLSVNAGVHACYSEAADAPAGAFLPWRTDDVEYVGCPPRALPAGDA
jgi:hypothetical protein